MSERRWQIPDELVQELLNAIEDKGKVYAKAKRRAAELEHKRKGMKASMMKVMEAHGIRSHQKQEVEALCHPTYELAVKAACDAIEQEVNAQVAFENAERDWESWRTISANERKATR